ncbi:LysR family transcriptional regulator [Paracidobacterium acidisoli]|uniref:LysR family transcriptional regulator n=1 Tax=Paracidobacterium acidisoli TaxID=2303751 RepID=A0A372IM08_9BACT|nr:LysR family transcriptional regulator [Paracidobacterium acidisoli]MBT9331603.1 LysR family transcriptional regulator [Paracidobacterium acidisoli]
MENFRLKVFRTVAAQASFRRAAELLHLSQPAVSQQIHALEEELGTPLFDRSGARVRLTDAGAVLLKYAERGAQLAAEALAAVGRVQGKATGKLRLGASTTVAQYVLPRMLGAFRKQHPRVDLAVMSGNTERVITALGRNEIQLGFIEGPASSREMHRQKFLEDRMVLIVPRRHPWASGGRIAPEALAGVPLLMRERGSGSRRVVELALRRAGLRQRQLHIAMDLDSTEAIVSGVEAGLGAGFVSQWAIGKEVRLGTVKTVAVDGLDIRRDFTLIRSPGPLPEGPAAAFERFALAEGKASGGDK